MSNADLIAEAEAMRERATSPGLWQHWQVYERLITALRAAEAEIARLQEPDMFWDWDDPENGASQEDEIVEEHAAGFAPVVIKMQCARSLPNYWIAATCPEDEVERVITRHKTREEAEAACDALRAAEDNASHLSASRVVALDKQIELAAALRALGGDNDA